MRGGRNLRGGARGRVTGAGKLPQSTRAIAQKRIIQTNKKSSSNTYVYEWSLDEMRALNPTLTVQEQLRDTLAVSETPETCERRARELLEQVQVDERFLTAYPHELSGGMRQRVMIALAISWGRPFCGRRSWCAAGHPAARTRRRPPLDPRRW